MENFLKNVLKEVRFQLGGGYQRNAVEELVSAVFLYQSELLEGA
jgi:hypothetical protein